MFLNTMQTILLAVIVLLSGYIIYLHLQLVKKTLLIESVVKKLSGMDRELSPDEIKKFIAELHTFNSRISFLEDKLFDPNVLGFLLGGEEKSRIYIHYTMDINVAGNILREGFRFVESFYKTALPVSNDRLDLMIKHNNKKFYGKYIIAICISEEIVSRYTAELESSGIKEYSFENILTEKPPEKNDNADTIYVLPPQFIKGYINYRTGEIVTNPQFNPGFISPGFSENIKKLKESGLFV